MAGKKVLLVDDQEPVRNLIAATLGGAGLDLTFACDGDEALERARAIRPDLILLDVMMPKRDGYEVCRILKGDPETRRTKIVMLTARDGEADVALGRDAGADDYFVKPFSPLALLSKVESLLLDEPPLEGEPAGSPGADAGEPGGDQSTGRGKGEQPADSPLLQRLRESEDSHRHLLIYAEELGKAYHQLQLTYFSTLEALASAIDARDHYTYGHSREVRNYAVMIGREMNLSPQRLESLQRAALLHEIGKIGVPNAILKKPEMLSSDEWASVRPHPELGYEMLSGHEFLEEALDGIRSHQERYDGKGYPQGLSGDRIPLIGRILAVADAFAAMTGDRPYANRLSRADAVAEISRAGGTQFDPEIVASFLKALAGKGGPGAA